MATQLDPNPQKVAVLGGGTGALASVFELTDRPGWQQQYEITVYQMGWRLGGKGASGRNRQRNMRIEEHGLHVWGGFYENAFSMIRRCYRELNRAPDQPLATWQEAFKPKTNVLWEEYIDSQWKHWQIEIPSDGKLPGEGHPVQSNWEYFQQLLDLLISKTQNIVGAKTSQVPTWLDLPTWLNHHLTRSSSQVGPAGPNKPIAAHESLIHARSIAADLATVERSQHSSIAHHGMVWFLEQFLRWFLKEVESLLALDDTLRRTWIFVDFMVTILKGIIADGILLHGWNVINDLNWVDWLEKHGASKTTLSSAVVRGWHDYFFAYRGGDPNQPWIEAGTSMRQLLRLSLSSRGAVFWEMQAGMGDAVFAPLYLVLKERGVKFEFFHRVKQLGLSDDKKRIETIKMGQQVTLNDGTYEPLIDVKGLPCWPSTPRFEQIVQGQDLHHRGSNLECPWADWQDIQTLELRRGVDFDIIILGTSIAPLKTIATELISASTQWQMMMDAIETTPTIAVQLWLDKDAAQMGSIDRALMTGYTDPLQTWGDFSHLLTREDWPADSAPKNLSYFCGPMTQAVETPAFDDHDFPSQQNFRAKTIALQSIQDNSAHLFPNVAPPTTGTTGLQWNVLHDPDQQVGRARFDAQYCRANVAPAELYVLSAPGSSRYRLTKGLSGFENLYVAGDWTFTGYAGSIEGAVMSGMMASRAISGYPAHIAAEVEPS